MTQEQLAERLEVSRQTISKWEAGASYAEMEKLLQICDIFSCDMDTLLRKDAVDVVVEDNEAHRQYMKKFRRGIIAGVTLMVADAAFYEFMAGLGAPDTAANTIFMGVAIVAILLLVVHGMQDDNYKKKHPVIQDFYTAEEKEAFDHTFPVRIAAGIGILLIGMLIFGMNGENLPLGKGMTEDFWYGWFMMSVAAAVGILVHSGMKKDEFNVEKYNRENRRNLEKSKKEGQLSVWCGCIMIVATILFFIMGFAFSLWSICWVVFPVGGMICGMAALIIQRDK